MKFLQETIADIALQIKTGKTPPTEVSEYFNGNINWYTPTDLAKETYLNKSSRTITDKAISDNKAVIFDKDTVLITCIGDIGKLGIVSDVASSNQQITGIKLNNKVFPLFFYYWCKRNKKLLENNSRQAVVSILNNETLGKIKISYPEKYDDQIRIAAVLTRAENLIAKRKESIKLLDEFLKSTFLEMFGDPVRNEKGWEVVELGFLSDEFKYGTNMISDDKNSDEKMPILRIPNVVGERISYNDLKYSTIDKNEKEKIRLKAGDLLFVRTNGNPAYIGRCAVFNDSIECGYASYLIRVRLKDNSTVSSNFIRDVISFPTYRHLVIDKAKTTAGNYNINTESLKSLKIYQPPVALQNKFAAVVEKVESIKLKYNESLVAMEKLYGSLSQRAFRGEL